MGSDEKPILERIERVLAELSRTIGVPDALPDHQRHEDASAHPVTDIADPGGMNEASSRLTLAIAWIRARKARDAALGEDLFFDPAWSILLELYVHHRQRTAVSITSLCIAAKVPSSTGLRWVTLLERRGLVSREPDPFDRRKIYASLTAEAVRKVEAALDSAAESNRQLGIERVRRVN